MRTILVTGSDTGVGKTHVVAALARMLAGDSSSAVRVQIVKAVETGRTDATAGDAATAQRLAGVAVEAFTLATFPDPIAPSAAAAEVGASLSSKQLVAATRALPACEWRIVEGAGGIATPVDGTGKDWTDFGRMLGVDAVVVVVPDRLGAINQGRLAYARAAQIGVPAGLWLNEIGAVDAKVAQSTREGLRSASIPIWAEQRLNATSPVDVATSLQALRNAVAADANRPRIASGESSDLIGESRDVAYVPDVVARCRAELADRDDAHLRRVLRVTARDETVLNLADNDYLELSHDPAVADAVARAAKTYGTSAAASPLITGWMEPHERLTRRLAEWHGLLHGMIWSSGFAANSAVLGGLPSRGDLVLADRLIHASMIAGLRHCGARLQRYEHLRLDRLEQLLAQTTRGARQVFVVTESVFSMDGDYPDLARMAELKRRYGFFWIVDEAHALGWYGPEGAGLIRAAGVSGDVDVLVGTFGKTLASGGAYALCRDEAVREFLVNNAGEFIYSTALPPTSVAGAAAALERVCELAPQQREWQGMSRGFRERLRAAGWQTADGDSPIVPVVLNDAAAALSLAAALRDVGIIAGAVRPPTVPPGTSRLRFSLKRTLRAEDFERVLTAMDAWRARQ